MFRFGEKESFRYYKRRVKMLDITEKILNTWKAKGVDTSRIEADKKEVDPKRMLLSDGQLLRFNFKIVGEYNLAFWKEILRASSIINCVAGNLTLRSSMNFKIKITGKDVDKLIYSDTPCYIEFKINIDEKYLTGEGLDRKQLDELTKPEFIKKVCVEEKEEIKEVTKYQIEVYEKKLSDDVELAKKKKKTNKKKSKKEV